MFRQVKLPDSCPGQLFLHSIPGRNEPLSDFVAEASAKQISRIVCLINMNEIESTSPDYGAAIANQTLPCPVEFYGITGFSIPDKTGFRLLINSLVERLNSGERFLIHCLHGNGRTSIAAVCILICLGMGAAEAIQVVADAGSSFESKIQADYVRWFEKN